MHTHTSACPRIYRVTHNNVYTRKRIHAGTNEDVLTPVQTQTRAQTHMHSCTANTRTLEDLRLLRWLFDRLLSLKLPPLDESLPEGRHR